MENSLRKKNRKPIFEKEQSRTSSPEVLFQTTASIIRDSVPLPQSVTFQTNLRPTFSPMRNTFHRPQSVVKPNLPINISFGNRPTSLIKYPISLAVQRPLDHGRQPEAYRTVIRPPINNQNQNKHYRSESSFYQPISTVFPQKYMSTQSNCFQQAKTIRADELKPTVVAIERIMKPIDENRMTSVTHFNPQINENYRYEKIRDPEQMRVYSKIERKVCEDEKISKLAQINNTLSRNYDILYDQLESLKRQVIQEDVVNQELLIQRAKHHFESLLYLEMQTATNKIEGIHRDEKRYYERENRLLTRFYNSK